MGLRSLVRRGIYTDKQKGGSDYLRIRGQDSDELSEAHRHSHPQTPERTELARETPFVGAKALPVFPWILSSRSFHYAFIQLAGPEARARRRFILGKCPS